MASPTRKGDGPGGQSCAGWPAPPHPGFVTWNLQTPVSPSGPKGPLEWDRSSRSTLAVTVASRCSFRPGGCVPEGLVRDGWDGIWSDRVGHRRSISYRASDHGSPGARVAQGKGDGPECAGRALTEAVVRVSGDWPLACSCHPDGWAGPRPQEAGSQAQAHPVWAEGWLRAGFLGVWPAEFQRAPGSEGGPRAGV